jgi:hypothetical protein
MRRSKGGRREGKWREGTKVSELFQDDSNSEAAVTYPRSTGVGARDEGEAIASPAETREEARSAKGSGRSEGRDGDGSHGR